MLITSGGVSSGKENREGTSVAGEERVSLAMSRGIVYESDDRKRCRKRWWWL
jgi:hypothetical protein